jgi:hypothetical protein
MIKEKMQFTEDDDPIDIRYDNVFKAVFTKNTPESQGALADLVSALIGRKLSIVAITAKERFFGDDIPLHAFEYYDPAHGVSLNGRSRIITLELSKLDKVVEKPVKDMSTPELWGVFFRYLQDKSKRGIINEILELEEGDQ